MLKLKYLHRKSNKYYDYDKVKKYWKCKNIDMFSDLPYHQSIRNDHWTFNYNITPLLRFLDSKIGQKWDDVYSEILKKIDKRYRFSIDRYLHCSRYAYGITLCPIYDDDYIPRTKYGKIVSGLYREDGILKEKSKSEIISDAKKYQRKEKLNEIFENKDPEYIYVEFNQKEYDDFLILDGNQRMKKWKLNRK